jgi:hypothetical protein
MIVSWFSAGVSSFVATWLERARIDRIIYIHIDEQHPDSLRFVADAEKLIGKPIEILQSPFQSVANVIRQTRCIKLVPSGYAKCTDRLKKQVRKEWESKQSEPLTYVWGFDADERHRADRLVEAMPLQSHLFPLIEQGLDKEQAHGLAKRLGLKRASMYDLGYNNNNCIGCVKGGMGYWNKIRRDFPDTFSRMAAIEREIGHSCIKGIYLDELDPERGRTTDEVMEDCGIACQLAWTK